MGDAETMWASGAYGYFFDYLLWWLIPASLVIHTWCFFKLSATRRWPRAGLVIGNTLIGLCLLSVVGLGAETYLRFTSIETDAYGNSLGSRRWLKLYPKLNSLYCRDVEWSEQKPQGVYRIAFMGDSFTYGWGIKDASARFTDILQRRFDKRGSERVEVMNVAWWAWDTREELRAAQYMIEDYDVDEIVLCYLPNDIDQLLPTDEYDARTPPRSTYVNTDASFLLDYLYYNIVARQTTGVQSACDWLWDGYTDPEVWGRQQQVLTNLIDLCRDNKVKIRVALLPLIKSWGERFDPVKLQAQLQEFFVGFDVPVVDLLPAIADYDPDTLIVNHHDPHPNERAHALLAAGIWRAFYADAAP